jgi:DNA-binding protein HU-beta
MHKNEFIKQLAKETSMSKREVSLVLASTLDLITRQLREGDKVVLTGFGTFEVRTRRGRRGVNPKTKEHISIPATQTPGFTASNTLKLAILQPTNHVLQVGQEAAASDEPTADGVA